RLDHAHRRKPARLRVLGRDVLQHDLELAELAAHVDLMRVADDGRVGNDAYRRLVQTQPRQTDGRRHVDVLGEAEGGLTGRTFVEDARLTRRHGRLDLIGWQQTGRRLAHRVCHRVEAADGAGRNGVQPGDGAG